MTDANNLKLPKWLERLHAAGVRMRNDVMTAWAEHGVGLGNNSNVIGRLLAQPQHADLASLYEKHRLDNFVPSHALGGMSTRPFMREAAQLGEAQHSVAKHIEKLLSKSSESIFEMQRLTLDVTQGAHGADQSMRMMVESKRLLGDRKVMGAFSADYATRVGQELTGTVAREYDKLQWLQPKVAKAYRVEESPVTELANKIRNAAIMPEPSIHVPLTGARPIGRAAEVSKVFAKPSNMEHAPHDRNGLLIVGAIMGAALVGAVLLGRDEKKLRQPDWQARMRLPQSPQQRSA